MNTRNEQSWDVIVVGGGSSGMMTAGTAAEAGARVLLVEKNPKLGTKLLLSGGGRCNLTNDRKDARSLAEKYPDRADYLYSAFAKWNSTHTLSFFHGQGMQTITTEHGRIYPKSERSQSVLDALMGYLRTWSVEIRTETAVAQISVSQGHVNGVILEDGTRLVSSSVVVASGSASRPETGSTGDGYRWLRDLGHTIVLPQSLAPLQVSEPWAITLPGAVAENVKVTVFVGGKKEFSEIGKLLFTTSGVSGPVILNMSTRVGMLLQGSEVILSIDLVHEFAHDALNQKLETLLRTDAKTLLRDTIARMIPTELVYPVTEAAKVYGGKLSNEVTHDERMRIISAIKGLTLTVTKLLVDEPVTVPSGGVSCDEVDFRTMQSRIIPGLFVSGDVLDIVKPSGGYSLQLCWTTGFIAGTNAAKKPNN